MTKIPRNELVEILAKLAGELPARKFSREVAGYLLRENRVSELDSLARDLVGYRAQKGIIEATVVSAHKLEAATAGEIKRLVKQLYPDVRQIIVNQKIDESQIGGVRLELPDRQLDLTLRAKLNKFKQLTMISR